MDKIVRNVIIFAGIVLVIAAGFTVFMVSRNNSPTNLNNVNGNAVTGTNNVGVNGAGAGTPSGEVQDATISVSGGTYIITPSTLKKGIPVRMTANMATFKGCSRSIVIASLGVRKSLTESDNVITFTPTQTGTINIACSMNMYRGTFEVVDAGTGSATTNAQGIVSSSAPVQEPTQTALSGSGSANTAPTHTCGMSGSTGSGGGCGCGG